VIIYPVDKPEIHRGIIEDKRLRNKRHFSWSAGKNKSDVRIVPVMHKDREPLLEVSYANKRFICRIPFSDRASVDNISTVVTCLLYLGFDSDVISEGVLNLSPVAMRMEQKEGINSCILLEDFYNSDPGSLRIAMEYLKGISDKKMTLILSDFVEGNRNREQLYREVAASIRKTGVRKLVAIGDDLGAYGDLFDADIKVFFKTTEDFISSFLPASFRDEAILIKGARKFEFERIGRLLELKTQQTRLEINLNAVLSNLDTFRTRLNRETKIMAMVKAFAYGAGPREISEWLIYNGIDYLAVAYPDEGISLRKDGITSRIMVMNPDPWSLRSLLEYDLEPEIYSMKILNSFLEEARRFGARAYPVHIKLDTGMHRLGFTDSDINEMIEVLTGCRTLKIASVFSHLAAAYDPDMDGYTHAQVRSYIRMSNLIREKTGSGFTRHLLNSAGTVRFPEYQFDMVRMGIGLYGISEVEMKGLRTATGFYTRISQVKTIEGGEGLGYGLTDVSDRKRKIAILPLGYADGLRRSMGQGR
jgi:alanine racemase